MPFSTEEDVGFARRDVQYGGVDGGIELHMLYPDIITRMLWSEAHC